MISPEDLEIVEMIRRSAAAVASRDDLSRVRRLRFTRPVFDPEVWRSICQLGWPALRLPEEQGGAGFGMTAYCALSRELGAALVPEPVIGAVLAAVLLDGDDLIRHLSGDSLVLPAWQDGRDAVGPAEDIADLGGKLHGRRHYVWGGLGARALLVIGPTRSWLVEAGAPGVTVEALDTQDGGHVATITLDGAAGRPLAIDPAPALAEACLATAAYLLGITEAAFDLTIAYLKTRVQFGKPIGSFQALQHRAVDLKIQVELGRASVEEAATRWDEAPGAVASLAAVSRAKARAASAAMLVCRQAIQLHGAIGYTDEHDIGLYLRKAMVVAPQFGSAALHRARFSELMRGEEGG